MDVEEKGYLISEAIDIKPFVGRGLNISDAVCDGESKLLSRGAPRFSNMVSGN